MSEFVYSVRKDYSGKLKVGRARVVKRTKSQLHIDPDKGQEFAFRYNTRCGHDAYAPTPEDAVQWFRATTRERISDLQESLQEARLELTADPEPMFS